MVTAVYSPKAGAGATSVSLLLAAQIGLHGKKCLLIQYSSGNTLGQFGIPQDPGYEHGIGLAMRMEKAGCLDAQRLQDATATLLPNRLYLLGGLARGSGRVKPTVKQALRLAKGDYDAIVLDVGMEAVAGLEAEGVQFDHKIACMPHNALDLQAWQEELKGALCVITCYDPHSRYSRKNLIRAGLLGAGAVTMPYSTALSDALQSPGKLLPYVAASLDAGKEADGAMKGIQAIVARIWGKEAERDGR